MDQSINQAKEQKLTRLFLVNGLTPKMLSESYTCDLKCDLKISVVKMDG